MGLLSQHRDRRVAAFRAAALLAAIFLPGCAFLAGTPPATVATPVPNDRFPLPPEGHDIVGRVQVAIARESDTLPEIARRYDLGYEEILAANPGVDPWRPGAGTRVVLPTAFILPDGVREGLVLNLASMRLFYYPKAGEGQAAEVVTHPVGIGREGWSTPQGMTRIVQKTANPSWTVPASVRREHAAEGDPLPAVVPPGPDNPLGEYAMRLSMPSYLIHGTNKPWGVGMRVSHGCIRLYPEDIARLFPEVPVGTPLRIINEPYVTGWRDGQLYLEAHAPLAEDTKHRNGKLHPLEQMLASLTADGPAGVDRERAEQIAREARGIPVPVSSGSAGLEVQLAMAPRVSSTPPWILEDYDIEELKQLPTYN
jgi:L,D-transpeptidase ErfK/SrfK